jgi:polyisoprenoid-binding protein YceI
MGWLIGRGSFRAPTVIPARISAVPDSSLCVLSARAFFALILTCAAALAFAQDSHTQQLLLDDKRSAADFEVKVLWLVGVHGRFTHVHGTISVDHFRNSAIVDARIDANAVSMRSRGHEEWVKSREFFDAAQFPEIRFVSESIPLQRLQVGGDIAGTLTLRGISKPVRFELAAPTCPGASGEDCPVEAEGSIRRSDFGMRSRHGTLSDRVELSFTIYAVNPKSSPAR